VTALHFATRDRSLASSLGTATKDGFGRTELNVEDVDQDQPHGIEHDLGRNHITDSPETLV
jgi:hypothetical protein